MIEVRGIVQGVGFRPHAYALARRHGLAGFVRNGLEGVRIEVEGAPPALEAFARELVGEAPPLARIAGVTCEARAPLGEARFRIEHTRAAGEASVFIAPDVATCADCLRELFDRADRRFRYPFVNCTRCGPRLTIVVAAPYDRERTTMAAFAMCAACRAEYEDPRDRRFHAQPIACPACGPRLSLLDPRGAVVAGDPLARAVEELLAERIVAVKGLGGYHLACDATSGAAVAELRRRKRREEKPFAVMVADAAAARALAPLSPAQEEVLASPARPIVLVRGESGLVGVMLPYTPLHHLLLRAAGRPLVMTSGNRASEPIAHEDVAALEQLSGVADLFLVHDRPIHVRCDDSVVRADGARPIPFRRSRGVAPAPHELPLALARPTLALGGHLKATVALGYGDRAFVSHHLGDLDHPDAQRAFAATIRHYARLFRIEPGRVVHDPHPDYASTLHAHALPFERRAVQHHHAHMASCMAENHLLGDAIGVIWDGAGLGDDGTIWGGEFLVGGYASVRRAAHLGRVPMPGGERAVREPWRMALAHLVNAGQPVDRLGVAPATVETLRLACARGVNAPRTSSVGRLFDAVAALLGTRRVSYEGQAAVHLEALAAREPLDGRYPFHLSGEDPIVVDPASIIRAVVEDLDRGTPAGRIARRFHSTLVAVVVAVCERLRARGLDRVVLSGGVFMNAILSDEAARDLERAGFHVFRHRQFPPNDGGLSLGQLAVAAGIDAAGRC